MGHCGLEYWQWLADTSLPDDVQRHWREDALYFGIANAITIPMVWALYPESNRRTLEEMDLVFAADSPWNWEVERSF